MRRLLTYGAVWGGLVVAAIVAVAAFQALHAPQESSGSGAPVTENCSPGPCADVQGFTLWVTNVQVNGNLVAMTVRFRNSSAATHASPEDLQLIDTSRRTSGLVTDLPGCKTWTRHEFNNGATFGPIDVCFRVNNATPPFVLRWSPDLGLFCCETDIKITT